MCEDNWSNSDKMRDVADNIRIPKVTAIATPCALLRESMFRSDNYEERERLANNRLNPLLLSSVAFNWESEAERLVTGLASRVRGHPTKCHRT